MEKKGKKFELKKKEISRFQKLKVWGGNGGENEDNLTGPNRPKLPGIPNEE